MRSAAVLFAVFVAVPALACKPAGKFSELPGDGYTLQGIVNEKDAHPFACSVGDFTLRVKGKQGDRVTGIFEGKGLLINRDSIDKDINANPDILYRLPSESKVRDGQKVSVFCSSLTDDDKPGNFAVQYLN